MSYVHPFICKFYSRLPFLWVDFKVFFFLILRVQTEIYQISIITCDFNFQIFKIVIFFLTFSRLTKRFSLMTVSDRVTFFRRISRRRTRFRTGLTLHGIPMYQLISKILRKLIILFCQQVGQRSATTPLETIFYYIKLAHSFILLQQNFIKNLLNINVSLDYAKMSSSKLYIHT